MVLINKHEISFAESVVLVRVFKQTKPNAAVMDSSKQFPLAPSPPVSSFFAVLSIVFYEKNYPDVLGVCKFGLSLSSMEEY